MQNLLSSSLLSNNLKIEIYRTTILPVVLSECETWSLIVRDEPRLRMFENRLLRRIFVPKRDEVRGEWRKVPYEELNDLYCSPNIVRVIKSRRMRWEGHVTPMGEGRGMYRVLVGKPEGKRTLNHWGDSGADGRIVLGWIFRKWDVGVWTGSSWLRIGTGGGHLKMR